MNAQDTDFSGYPTNIKPHTGYPAIIKSKLVFGKIHLYTFYALIFRFPQKNSCEQHCFKKSDVFRS